MDNKQHRQIFSTTNYRLFDRQDGENRTLNPKSHTNLCESMRRWGFLPSHPIIVKKAGRGKFFIRDGQHRAYFAESLGIPIYYVIEEADFDIGLVNAAQTPWKLPDFAKKYADSGSQDYQELLVFMDEYKLPIGSSVNLLSGIAGFSNVRDSFVSGKFKIADAGIAYKAAELINRLCAICPSLKRHSFYTAIAAVCRVPGFDGSRLVHNATERCREKLVPYAQKKAILQMLDEVYNFGQRNGKVFPLKHHATMIDRERERDRKSKPKVDGKKVA